MLRLTCHGASRSSRTRFPFSFKPPKSLAFLERQFHQSRVLDESRSTRQHVVVDLSTILETTGEHQEDSEATSPATMQKGLAASEMQGQLQPFGTDLTYLEYFSCVVMWLPHEAFVGVHYAVPWWMAIPTTAFILRAISQTMTWRLSEVSRKRIQTVHAFNMAYKHLTSTPKGQPETDAANMRRLTLHGWRNTITKRYKAYPFSVTRWNLLNIPIWLATIEALRSMVGTNYGLFGLICRSLGLSAKEGNVLIPSWVETSMTDEGVLWFPNLVIPDPTGGLSIVLGLTIAGSIYKSTAAFRRPDYVYEGGPLRRVWVFGAPLLGTIVVPLTLQFPAALVLYWITTSISAPIIKAYLDRITPKPMSLHVKPLTTGFGDRVSPAWLRSDVSSINDRSRSKSMPGLNRIHF